MASGTCGSNATWNLNESTGVLTISGTGAMNDYSDATSVPWTDYVSRGITSIEIGEGITTVGDYAFINCFKCTSVSLPETLISIGETAFCRCTTLPIITIPKKVTTIGGDAFSACSSLRRDIFAPSATGLSGFSQGRPSIATFPADMA